MRGLVGSIERSTAPARSLLKSTLPGAAAVARAEDAALAVGAPGVAEGGDVDEVRVGRVDADAPDVAGVAQADGSPGAAAVGGPVDAVAVRDVAADAGLAHADVDHVGVGRRDGERADGGGLEEAVGDVLPVRAAVGGLPHAARAGAEVEGRGLGRMAGDGDHTAAAVRPDAAPLERTQQTWIDGHRASFGGFRERLPEQRRRRLVGDRDEQAAKDRWSIELGPGGLGHGSDPTAKPEVEPCPSPAGVRDRSARGGGRGRRGLIRRRMGDGGCRRGHIPFTRRRSRTKTGVDHRDEHEGDDGGEGRPPICA